MYLVIIKIFFNIVQLSVNDGCRRAFKGQTLYYTETIALNTSQVISNTKASYRKLKHTAWPVSSKCLIKILVNLSAVTFSLSKNSFVSTKQQFSDSLTATTNRELIIFLYNFRNT